MIDPIELRIGNLVTVNNIKFHPKLKDEVLKVISITEMSEPESYSITLEHLNAPNIFFSERYSQKNEYIEPIKFTPYWFNKLTIGFTKGSKKPNQYWIAFHNMHIDIYYHEEEDYFYYHTNQLQSIKILYVNEFQNLIYALSKVKI